jgi:hypothetical protein
MNAGIAKLMLAVIVTVTVLGLSASNAAPAECTWFEDENKSPKTVYLDKDGDGIPDAAMVDKDNDGKWDKGYLDNDDDGDWDTEFSDDDDDGDWDSSKHDRDGDDKYDRKWTDKNGNNKVDPGEVQEIKPPEDSPTEPRPKIAPEERDCCGPGGPDCPDLPPWPSSWGDIPTLSEWGMIIFGVVLLGFMSWVFLRRRRAVASLR